LSQDDHDEDEQLKITIYIQWDSSRGMKQNKIRGKCRLQAKSFMKAEKEIRWVSQQAHLFHLQEI